MSSRNLQNKLRALILTEGLEQGIEKFFYDHIIRVGTTYKIDINALTMVKDSNSVTEMAKHNLFNQLARELEKVGVYTTETNFTGRVDSLNVFVVKLDGRE